MTTEELPSNDMYGYLKHPSGLVLPKVLRDQLQQSLREKGVDQHSVNDLSSDIEEIKMNHYQIPNQERYWNVTEIIDMMNATSEKIQNLQTQIIHGEDYYVNNVTSISVYNTKNNYSDSTAFLDSKMDTTSSNNMNNNNYPGNNSSSNAGSNATITSYGINNNQHRWFSSSFTDIKPYQQAIPYPTIPRKENIASLSSVPTSRPIDNVSVVTATLTTQQSSDKQESGTFVAATASSDGTTITSVATSSKDVTTAATTTTATVVSKRGRTANLPISQPPARRSTKRRRKT